MQICRSVLSGCFHHSTLDNLGLECIHSSWDYKNLGEFDTFNKLILFITLYCIMHCNKVKFVFCKNRFFCAVL